MTTINIFIEQGEGIEVEFMAKVKHLKRRYSHFDIPEVEEPFWNKKDFTPKENAIIEAYLNDNYQYIESRLLERAETMYFNYFESV